MRLQPRVARCQEALHERDDPPPGDAVVTGDFDLSFSSVAKATHDYLASLEWIRAKENLCLIGPAGTGKSHILIALGHAAVELGHRVRYFTADVLVETLYRGLADNTVGKVINQTLRADLVIVDEIGFAPLDFMGGQLLFRFVGSAYERVALGIASHHAFENWGRFLPETTTAASLSTASSTTASSWSPKARAIGCEKPKRKEAYQIGR